jgi:hypothetical protein
MKEYKKGWDKHIYPSNYKVENFRIQREKQLNYVRTEKFFTHFHKRKPIFDEANISIVPWDESLRLDNRLPGFKIKEIEHIQTNSINISGQNKYNKER